MASGRSASGSRPGVTYSLNEGPTAFAREKVLSEVPIAGVTDLGLGNTTWVAALGDDVLVIDPERDPTPYLSVAEQLTASGANSFVVADTHLHADFLSGAAELKGRGA